MINVDSEVSVSRMSFVPLVSRVIKCIVFSYLLSVVMIAVLAAVVCYTDVPEAVSGPGVMVITYVGVFVSAFICAAKISQKGWLAGGITGICNVGILMLIAMFAAEAPFFTFSNCLEFICGFIFGSAGGIAGINFFRK